MVRASGDGGAAAHRHGPEALFAEPTPPNIVPPPPDVVPASADVVPATADVVLPPTAVSNVVPLLVTSKGRHR